jgi:hypothetical protein
MRDIAKEGKWVAPSKPLTFLQGGQFFWLVIFITPLP